MRVRYRQSLIALPVLYLAGACALGLLVPQLDARREVQAAPGSGIGTARDILTATATGMIAFTGFVVASVLVVVQFAAGQYSPRLVLWFRRDALTKHAIGASSQPSPTRSSRRGRSRGRRPDSRPTSR